MITRLSSLFKDFDTIVTVMNYMLVALLCGEAKRRWEQVYGDLATEGV